MKRTISWLLLSLAILVIAGSGGAHAETEAAPDSSWARIGEIHSDTLFVSRDKVVALALEQNEMLAASGAMRDAVRATLSGHSLVRKWRPGERGEGGDGATVVSL